MRAAFASVRSLDAEAPIETLGEGWGFWAYAAGDTVLRVPKREKYVTKLDLEARLTAALAPELPAPISVIAVHAGGPNGLPFTTHKRVPGVTVQELGRPLAQGFGAALGRFIKALHAFPVDRAAALGVPVMDATAEREGHAAHYERCIRELFPLLSCESRVYVSDRFEAYLNDESNWRFESRLTHADIDQRNVLADPITGELTGVIDFGDARVGESGGDFTYYLLYGLGREVDRAQIDALLREGGVLEGDVRPHCEFYRFCWPLWELEHGLEIEDELFVQRALEMLNADVPREIRC